MENIWAGKAITVKGSRIERRGTGQDFAISRLVAADRIVDGLSGATSTLPLQNAIAAAPWFNG